MLNDSNRPHLFLVRDERGAEQRNDDTALARGLIAGEAGTAEIAWRRFAPMVHGLLRRSLGPESDVEDATQEVFLRVFSRVSSLADLTALRSFIFSVAVRVARWELRRRRVRRMMHLTQSGRMPAQAANPLDSEARNAVRRFYAILDQIGSGERAAFVLRHFEGLDLIEAARVLDISLATLKRRLSRAEARINSLALQDPALASYLSPVALERTRDE